MDLTIEHSVIGQKVRKGVIKPGSSLESLGETENKQTNKQRTMSEPHPQEENWDLG